MRLGHVVKIHSFRLQCVEGPDRGREWLIDRDAVTLGSGAESDIQLSDETVSRQHASLERTPRGWKVCDRGSVNGLALDGVPIEAAYLRADSRLVMGTTTLTFTPREESILALPSKATRFSGVLGGSSKMREVFGVLDRVAPLDVSIILTGPTGTGKGLIASSIHAASKRRQGPFHVLDCGNLDANLIRAELFGHVKGAFTGAETSRPGIFEAATGGTLFIDEIGELPIELQPRLLRVLEERKVCRLGSQETFPVDVRVVAATHRDLSAMVDEGTFREDLLYRLAVVELEVPALRERLEDIPMLAQSFLEQQGASAQWPLAAAVLERLQQHTWPGNVRELRNVIERAVALSGGETIAPEHLRLRAPVVEDLDEDGEASGLAAQVDRETIERVLRELDGNRTLAAHKLGIAVTTLRRRMKKYGLE